MKLVLASIRIHPVKSLGGYAVDEAFLTDRGLEHDRRWMLVDAAGNFITQREVPGMACLHITPLASGFRITDVRNGSTADLPWFVESGARIPVSVWSSRLAAYHYPDADRWLSKALGRPVRAVFMPDTVKRRSSPSHAPIGTLNSFSDAYPYLIISQASLDDLRVRVGNSALPMDRFRPNLVVSGGIAFQEDAWKEVRIGAHVFNLVKPCARCVMINTDQDTGERHAEPLRTLATYRRKGKSVLFGMNAVGEHTGIVRIGDAITLQGMDVEDRTIA